MSIDNRVNQKPYSYIDNTSSTGQGIRPKLEHRFTTKNTFILPIVFTDVRSGDVLGRIENKIKQLLWQMND